MLPVALTCPLWWVARWATRVLTSLAVVAALALGAGASPASAGSPTSADAASTFTASGPITRQATVTPGIVTGPRTPSGLIGVVAIGHLPSVVAADVADRHTSTRSVDPQPARLAAGILPAATGVTAASAARSEWRPHARGPASRAPRAPPSR
ncbi:hypothetical protein [Micromonospora sp. NPDC093244]|uniref:hypothetical protein n=1 Tax=Micromonospora sp. NPDC093244 TaxID=3155071 RepID=UPI003443D7B0